MTEAFVVTCIIAAISWMAGVAFGIAIRLPKAWTDDGLWHPEPPDDDIILLPPDLPAEKRR